MLVWGLDGNCMYLYLYCPTKQIEETRHVWELRKIHYDRESPLMMRWGRDEVEATPERLLALTKIVSLHDHLSQDIVVSRLDHSHLSFSVRAHLKGRAGTRGNAARRHWQAFVSCRANMIHSRPFFPYCSMTVSPVPSSAHAGLLSKTKYPCITLVFKSSANT